MELRLPFQVDYFLVGADGRMRLPSLLRLFQEAAVRHAEKRGFGGPDISRKGWGWVLYKLEADVARYPRFEEEVEVVTRLGGWKGMKAYRHFELFKGSELLASALSVWFLIDAASRRPLHLSEELFSSVSSQPGFPPAAPAGEWKPGKEFPAQRETLVTTRWSDIDTNGHVNNTAYADFVETALAREGEVPCPARFRIQYNHEISREVAEVRVVLARSDGGWSFRVANGDRVCAQGETSHLSAQGKSRPLEGYPPL
jgi:acyl-ACP thioesterase